MKLRYRIRRWLGIDTIEVLKNRVTDLSGSFATMSFAGRKHYEDLLHGQQEIEQKLDRLLMLLEPRAERLRATPRVVSDWDAVQRENLKQFEEPQR